MSRARHSHYTYLGWKSLGSSRFGAYPIVAEVIDCKPTGIQTTVTETSHLLSPEAHKEFIPGMVDNGEVTFSANWFLDHFQQLRDYVRTRTMFYLLVVFPDQSSTLSYGFWSSIGIDVPFDDRIKCDATFKKTGVSEEFEDAAWTFGSDVGPPVYPFNPLSAGHPVTGTLAEV